jgi:outer membrane protein TolC
VGWADGTITVRSPESLPSGKTFTLEECIDLALRNQASIREANAAVTNQSGQVQQSKSALLPGVSASSSTQVLNDTPYQGTQVDLSASQLIYDFGRSKSKLSSAQRQLAASQEALSGTRDDVVLSVKQAYYNLLHTNGLVEVYAETLKDQEGHVTQAQEQKNVGVAPLADVLKAQAAAASARFDLVTARNNADQARVALDAAMGVDIQSPITIKEIAEPEPSSLDQQQLVSIALTKRPEVLQSENLIQADQALVRVAQTGNMPSVSTQFDRSQGIGQGEAGSPNSYELLMNVTWNAFDSGNTAGAIKSAKAQLESAQEALYAAKQTVTQDVVQARLNVISAGEQLSSAVAEVASAKENLGVATGRYEAGVGILLDVLDAEAALLKAESDELAARYGLSTARAVLEHAIGGSTMRGVNL